MFTAQFRRDRTPFHILDSFHTVIGTHHSRKLIVMNPINKLFTELSIQFYKTRQLEGRKMGKVINMLCGVWFLSGSMSGKNLFALMAIPFLEVKITHGTIIMVPQCRVLATSPEYQPWYIFQTTYEIQCRLQVGLFLYGTRKGMHLITWNGESFIEYVR